MVKTKGRLAEWNDERGFGFIEMIKGFPMLEH